MAKKKSRHKLTQRQQSRVWQNKQQKFSSAQIDAQADLVEGQIIKHLGHDLTVKTQAGFLLCKVQKTVCFETTLRYPRDHQSQYQNGRCADQ